jgi:flagellar hook-associated protein 1
MSLSSALSTAQSIFTNTGTQMAVTSKNIANASNSDYQRRTANVVTTDFGSRVVSTTRTEDASLARLNMDALSSSSAQTRVLDGLNEIKSALGDNEYESAPSTYMATLRDTIQTFATKPGEVSLGQSMVTDAKALANSLNTVSNVVQGVRLKADKDIAQEVTLLNGYLAEFGDANDKVKGGTSTGADVNDALDKRDEMLRKISEIVGVTSVTRGSNDMALYTSDGTVLFETSARTISFTPKTAYTAEDTGNAVYIDGVPLSSGSGGDSSSVGSIQGLLQLRDSIAPDYQSQLDETARGLVTLFAEKDQTASGLPDMPGLFTWDKVPGPADVPASGTLTKGIASSIKINPAVDFTSGGNPRLVRDGGINGASYKANTNDEAGYSEQLEGYVAAFDVSMSFDADAKTDTTSTLMNYASTSVGWFEQLRKDANTGDERKQATLSRTTETLSNKTGVSLDEELSLLLDLEQSYKASTKIVQSIDEMMQALLAMVK